MSPLPWPWRVRGAVAAILLPPLPRFISLSTLTRWIERPSRPGRLPWAAEAHLAEWVDRIQRRLPGPWKSTCLSRSLVLHYLLHRAGRPAELRIGVRRESDRRLVAHAWLVRDGQPILGHGAEHEGAWQPLSPW